MDFHFPWRWWIRMDFGVDSVAAPNDDATLPGRRLQSPVESRIDKKLDFTLSLQSPRLNGVGGFSPAERARIVKPYEPLRKEGKSKWRRWTIYISVTDTSPFGWTILLSCGRILERNFSQGEGSDR